jgi:hypothetical protein
MGEPVAVRQARAEAHRQRSSLLSDLLDHVFDCPDDFLIGEVDALALPRHDAGAAGESVQRMIDQRVHALGNARGPDTAVAECRCAADAGWGVAGDTDFVVDLRPGQRCGHRFGR